jgi:hypothetical protein
MRTVQVYWLREGRLIRLREVRTCLGGNISGDALIRTVRNKEARTRSRIDAEERKRKSNLKDEERTTKAKAPSVSVKTETEVTTCAISSLVPSGLL